ncbi:MAG: hypothetical protein IJZ39_01495 [Oscillospiraceae bacterium]|nr:hypothetical protein [Oscillospiraceae bacterium]
MERAKTILLAIAKPPAWIGYPFILAGFGLILYVAFDGQAETPLAYVSYGLSAYALILLCFRLPGIIRFWIHFRKTNSFALRYFSDLQYRTTLSLNFSTVINLLYAALQLYAGVQQASVWFYALAAYYAMLALMRFFLLKETRIHELGRDRFREYLHYRLIAVLLLVLNLALGIICADVVTENRGFRHHQITTIAMAAYTFWSLGLAIVSIFRYRKYRSPVLSASKHISLTSAMVSMLSLETAMFSSFGSDDPTLRFWITACSGAAIFITVLALAIYMLILARNELNNMKGTSQYGSEK